MTGSAIPSKMLKMLIPIVNTPMDLHISDYVTDGKTDIKAYFITPRLFAQNSSLGSELLEHPDRPTDTKPECG